MIFSIALGIVLAWLILANIEWIVTIVLYLLLWGSVLGVIVVFGLMLVYAAS